MLKHLGINSIVANSTWIENHYRWIVWKLACYDRKWTCSGDALPPKYLTADNVLKQLLFRYDREYVNGKRSCLHRVLTRDVPSTRYMILCIAHIHDQDGSNISQIDLTDGWYSIRARVDPEISDLIKRRKLQSGQKLKLFGANISGGDDQACPPLEADPNSVHLLLCANAVRKVKQWWAPLGFSISSPFKIKMKSIKPQGGTISHLDVIVMKAYPLLYLDKPPQQKEGEENQIKVPSIIRSRRAEEQYAIKIQDDKQLRMEKLTIQYMNELQEEKMAEKRSKRSKSNSSSSTPSSSHLRRIIDGQKLYQIMNESSDPDSFTNRLTHQQQIELDRYQRVIQEREQQEIIEMVRKDVSTEDRQVTCFLTVILSDCCPSYTDHGILRECKLTIWSATDESLEMFAEGNRLSVFQSVPNASSNDARLSITANRKTQFHITQLKKDVSLDLFELTGYQNRRCTLLSELCDGTAHGTEFDTVGVVVYVGEKQVRTSAKNTTWSVQDFFVTDGSIYNERPLMMEIHLRESETRVLQWTHVGQMKLIGFQNLIFDRWDAFRNTIVCTASEGCNALTSLHGYKYLVDRRDAIQIDFDQNRNLYEQVCDEITQKVGYYKEQQRHYNEQKTQQAQEKSKNKQVNLYDYFDQDANDEHYEAHIIICGLNFFYEDPCVVVGNGFSYQVPVERSIIPQQVKLFEQDYADQQARDIRMISLNMQLHISVDTSETHIRVVFDQVMLSKMIKCLWQYPVLYNKVDPDTNQSLQDLPPPSWLFDLCETGSIPSLEEDEDKVVDEDDTEENIFEFTSSMVDTINNHRRRVIHSLLQDRPYGNNAAPMLLRFVLLYSRVISVKSQEELEGVLSKCSLFLLMTASEWSRFIVHVRRSLADHTFDVGVDEGEEDNRVKHISLRERNKSVEDTVNMFNTMELNIDDF
ncbi:BRCA2 [Acrasis kona]|uniref:BRCA2 n=1 Tax=Acrasis kona TaxID=1008807 RepID=A0AAW2YS96_9EUKA